MHAEKKNFHILKIWKKSYILSRTRALYDKNSFLAPTLAGFLELRHLWNVHALIAKNMLDLHEKKNEPDS